MSKAIALVAVMLLLPLAALSFRFLGATPAEDDPPAISVGAPANEAAVQDEQLLRGTVISRRDRMALEGAFVWLIERVEGVTGEPVETNARGEFQFSVEAGEYVLSAQLERWRCETVRTTYDPPSPSVVIACEPWPPVRPRRVTTVRISVADDTVTVSPDPLYIRPGDCVFWTSDVGPWAVHFSPISPLTHRRIRGTGAEPEGGCAREDIFPGKYSYFVAVEVDGIIYTEDPELIDENEN